jgi:hypothetical protein
VLKIADGLDADFVLLFFSPDSVDSKWVMEESTDAYWHRLENQSTKFASDFTGDGLVYPALCGGGTSPGMWMLSYRSAPTRHRVLFQEPGVCLLRFGRAGVSARTLSVITFSRQSHYPIGHHVCCLYRPGYPGPAFGLNALGFH